MVHVHRRRDGIHRRVNAGMRLWGRTSRRGENEGLAAEYPKKLLTATPAAIGVDIALVPGHRKGRRWDLEHEEGEARIRRQTINDDVHTLVCPHVVDRYVSMRVRQAIFRPSRDHHVELEPIRRRSDC